MSGVTVHEPWYFGISPCFLLWGGGGGSFHSLFFSSVCFVVVVVVVVSSASSSSSSSSSTCVCVCVCLSVCLFLSFSNFLLYFLFLGRRGFVHIFRQFLNSPYTLFRGGGWRWGGGGRGDMRSRWRGMGLNSDEDNPQVDLTEGVRIWRVLRYRMALVRRNFDEALLAHIFHPWLCKEWLF